MLPVVTRALAKCKIREKSVRKDNEREMVCGHHLQNKCPFWRLSCCCLSYAPLICSEAGEIDAQSLMLPNWTDRYPRSWNDLVLYSTVMIKCCLNFLSSVHMTHLLPRCKIRRWVFPLVSAVINQTEVDAEWLPVERLSPPTFSNAFTSLLGGGKECALKMAYNFGYRITNYVPFIWRKYCPEVKRIPLVRKGAAGLKPSLRHVAAARFLPSWPADVSALRWLRLLLVLFICKYYSR